MALGPSSIALTAFLLSRFFTCTRIESDLVTGETPFRPRRTLLSLRHAGVFCNFGTPVPDSVSFSAWIYVLRSPTPRLPAVQPRSDSILLSMPKQPSVAAWFHPLVTATSVSRVWPPHRQSTILSSHRSTRIPQTCTVRPASVRSRRNPLPTLPAVAVVDETSCQLS